MSLAIDEAIPRHQPENPLNYSDLQMAHRKKALLDMKKDYPNIPDGWLEISWSRRLGTEQASRSSHLLIIVIWALPIQFAKVGLKVDWHIL